MGQGARSIGARSIGRWCAASRLVLVGLLSSASPTIGAQAFHVPYEALAPKLELDWDGTLPFSGASESPLLSGQLRLSEWLDALDYGAHYTFARGDVLQFDGDSSSKTLLSQLGTGTFDQSLTAKLPALIGPPLVLALKHAQVTQWTFNGATPEQTRTATLNWSPAPAAFELQWAASDPIASRTSPLECRLKGNVRVGSNSGGRHRGLRFGGRSCEVTAEDPALSQLQLVAWSSGLEWGSAARRQAITLSMLEPRGRETAEPISDTLYELNLTQTRTQGRWLGSAELGVRLDDTFAPAELDIPSWTASASVRRKLNLLALSAGWQHAANPLWFIPGSEAYADSFSVGFDFAPALRLRRQDNQLSSTLSYRWSQPYAADAQTDEIIQWQVNYEW